MVAAAVAYPMDFHRTKASYGRPRFTTWLRAKDPKREPEDYDIKYIQRIRAMGRNKESGTNVFGLGRFGGKKAGDKVGRAYQSFLKDVQKISTEDGDMQSIAEYIYEEITKPNANEKTMLEGIKEVVSTFTKLDLKKLIESAKELAPYDSKAVPLSLLTPSTPSASSTAQVPYGQGDQYKYPGGELSSVGEQIFDRVKECITIQAAELDNKGTSKSPITPIQEEETALEWLKSETEVFLVSEDAPTGLTVEDVMYSLLSEMEKAEVNQTALMDLLGFGSLEFLFKIMDEAKRATLLSEFEALKNNVKVDAPLAGKKKGRQQRQVAQKNEKGTAGVMQLLRSIGVKKGEGRPKNEEDQVVIDADEPRQQKATRTDNINISDYMGMGLKVVLPKGTKRTNIQGSHEMVVIPAPEGKKKVLSDLVPVADMPEFARLIFKHETHFNTIQSKVYHAAYGRDTNILVCAPTGAGKTNVALLTIARLLGKSRAPNGTIPSNVKIIYMAPMKALCSEITEKFHQRLAPLGCMVREVTGDTQLSKKELEQTNILVTVPEKWDVMTRNSTSTGGEEGIQSLVQLVIIDEVHLLNDDRGSVIECVVARTNQYSEKTGHFCRTVGISATLPNYMDVATFLRVSPENVFYFDASFRPIPLEQSFIGVSCENAKKAQRMTELTYDQVIKSVKAGHQCMVFVHARNDTLKTAEALFNIAVGRMEVAVFDPKESTTGRDFLRDAGKARAKQVTDLFMKGFGMHHAGMVRSDRTLTEKLFAAGAIKVLCCTATLAWGVNLPARHVVIKGTNIFDSQSGGFKNLGVLDVMQIFGRAGRPQFDNLGQATLITDHKNLNNYIRLMNHQVPIESQFQKFIVNALNAEICMGNISSEKDAAEWLKYTYMFVRYYKAPVQYGITTLDLQEDPSLLSKRIEVANAAAMNLNRARLIRIDNAKNYSTTDLGRVSARFYIDWETAETFSKGIANLEYWDHSGILALFGQSKEFEQLKIRDEEIQELEELSRDPVTSGSRSKASCRVKIKGGCENVYGKVAILLQAYISRTFIDSFSLMSDCNYIVQNASRLFRALFEISLTRVTKASNMTDALLEWTKIIEQRVWHNDHTLMHFCHPPQTKSKAGPLEAAKGGVLDPQVVLKLNKYDYWRLLDMSLSEIKDVTQTPAAAKAVQRYLWRVPNLTLDAKIQPITSSIMRITLKITPNFEWSDRWSGQFEPFYVWVENPSTHDILHTEQWTLLKKQLHDTAQLSFAIPLQQPRPNQYVIKVVSDRWVNISFTHEFSVQHLLLPDQQNIHTPLLDLTPLPKTVLHNAGYEKLYKFDYFNAIQTQVFHTCYHTDYNLLMGAPTGSGKTIVAEFAMYRLFDRYPNEKVIYIAPLKALAKERIVDWGERFGRQLGKHVVELTGDFTPDVAALAKADVVITTPEKWDGISRHWKHRAYVRDVGLIIIDEIHLLGQDRGPVLEVIVSRMRYISCNLDKHIRFVGLSTALANARDIADWLGIGVVGLFNFKPSVRPVPMTAHIQGYPEKHYCPRMATMNKPVFNAIQNHSPTKPVLVFVSSRRQTRLTALDLKALIASDEDLDPKMWVRMDKSEQEYVSRRIQDNNLRDLVEFGIGIHHAGINEKDRLIVEDLFVKNKIMVLISTSTLAWGVNFPAHLVVVKGTEYYDGALKRYVDFPVTDVLQMMGRAGRPQFDDSAVAVIMCHEPKKQFYRRFLYEPFPVESSLHDQLTDHLNAEIVSKTITTKDEAIDYISWTYFFRRLTANPGYYDPESGLQEEVNQGKQKEMLALYVDRLMNKCLDELVRTRCIQLRGGGLDSKTGEVLPLHIEALSLGRIASLYYMRHRTVSMFHKVLATDESLTFVEVLKAVSNCPEYEELPVRHNEDKMNAEWGQKCPLEVDVGSQSWDSPHTKAFLLFQSHLFSIPVPSSDFKTDLKSVLDRSIPIIQAMVDIAAHEGMLQTTLNLILLLQCLHQATHPWQSDLLTLPHINETHVDMWAQKQGPTHLAQLVEGEIGRELTKLNFGSSLKMKECMQVVEGLPQVRVEIGIRLKTDKDKEGSKEEKGPKLMPPYKVPAGRDLILDVTLRYNNSCAKFAHAPKFPKKKTYSWWVMLGDTEVDELVALKRVMMEARYNQKRTASFDFGSPDEDVGQTFTLSVILASDSYVGLDQQYDIELTTY